MKTIKVLSLVREDYLIYKKIENRNLIKTYLLSPSFRYIITMRLCKFFKLQHPKFIFIPLFIFFRFILKHKEYKYGIEIPYGTDIGGGFHIGHCGGIVVHHKTKFGEHCGITNGVTIGAKGNIAPIFGNNVNVAAGAKVIGNIKVGNNVTIAPNCVVTKDVPDNCIVAGIPASIIRLNGERIDMSLKEYWNKKFKTLST